MEVLEDFLRDCRLRGRTKRTLEGYKSSVSEFLTIYPEPERVTTDELEAYLEVLQRRDLKIKTMKSYFSAVSSLYEYLIFKKRTSVNPVLPFRQRYLDKPNKSDRRQLLSVNSMRLLINSIPLDHIREIAMLVTLAKTGARKQEFIDILAEDVDTERMILKLPQPDKRYNRFIPMDHELCVVLETYLEWRQRNVRDECPYLWINQRGHQIDKDEPNKVIQEFAYPIGLHEPGGPLERRLRCHSFRKFFTHHLVKAGMPEIFVQVLRGDSLKDAAWKDNYLEPEDLINEEIRDAFLVKIPQLICY